MLAATVLLKFTSQLPVGFFMPLLVLAVVYVPGTLLLATLLGRLGGVGVVFQRDYSPLLTCAAMAFAAAEIPLALAASFVPVGYLLIPAVLYFALLMFFAVRTVFGVESGIAAGVVALSWLPLVAAAFIWGPLQFLLGMLASPFFLFFAWYYLGGELSGLGAGLRSRQNFRRMLEAATVNPHDGEAQYQLGLIHQQRHQYTEAIARFKKAIEIDPSLTDAHFQLGRIAREQGRLRDALAHFQTVVSQDERHSSSEVLRELGGIYVAARQYARCAQRTGDLHRAAALRSGRPLLLRPNHGRSRRYSRGPRSVCRAPWRPTVPRRAIAAAIPPAGAGWHKSNSANCQTSPGINRTVNRPPLRAALIDTSDAGGASPTKWRTTASREPRWLLAAGASRSS